MYFFSPFSVDSLGALLNIGVAVVTSWLVMLMHLLIGSNCPHYAEISLLWC